LRLSDIDYFRSQKLSSVLLFLTDRCPVKCRHCSVNSEPQSPTIKDFGLFEDIINSLSLIDSVQAVGISGGEPFIEKRGLELSVSKLRNAEKRIALYTSGYWGGNNQNTWIDTVLKQVNTVVLSTDAFHRASISEIAFTKALQRIANADTWLIIQTILSEQTIDFVYKSLKEVFGDSWKEKAEINEIPLLSHGKAEKYFPLPQMKPLAAISKCTRSNSPVVRYDGIVTACTNESIIMGKGPNALRKQITQGTQLLDALISLSENPIVNTLSKVGPIALINDIDLDDKMFCNVCDVCWQKLI